MNARILVLISIFLLASCSLGLSERDKASVKKIADTWGGECSYGMSSSVSSEKGKRKTFTLTLENSPAFNSDVPKETIASNMALTMYEGWTEQQRSSYTHIITTLKYNGQTFENDYPVSQLKTVSGQKNLFQEYVNNIEHHNFKEIIKHMDPAYYTDSSVVALNTQANYQDSIYGPVVSSRLLGFQFFEKELSGQNLNLLRLYGLIERKKEKVSFILVIDPLKKTDEYYLYYLKF